MIHKYHHFNKNLIFLDCWNGEPDNRPTINQIIAKLKEIITKDDVITKDFHLYNSNTDIQAEVSENKNNSLHGDLSQNIQNFDKMNTRDIASISLSDENENKQTLTENDFNATVYEMNVLFNNGSEIGRGQEISNYLNNHNINSQEVYYWLLNNQNDLNSIVVFGYFNYFGIGTSIDNQKAFKLFQKAANSNHPSAISQLGNCYQHVIKKHLN